MSEKQQASNMFEATDIAGCFRDILASTLEAMASKDDKNGCLEVIKFVRRYAQDVPVSDYRTVGEPTAIRGFLTACGLVMGSDYTVERSTLDENSYVITLSAASTHTNVFLGCIFGLRVTTGASVSDRLYCELCKDSERDFRAAIDRSDASPDGSMNIREYVLDRTLHIYKTVAGAKLDESSESTFDFKRDADIVAFAASQIKDGALMPSAIPVVPPAVAEFYARLDFAANNLPIAKKPRLFCLDGHTVDFMAARGLGRHEFGPSWDLASAPIGEVRKTLKRIDAFMPRDAYEFMTAPVDDSNGGGSAVSVFACCGSQLRFPNENPRKTLEVFNIIETPMALGEMLESFYVACYPEMRTALLDGSDVWLNASDDEKETQANPLVFLGMLAMSVYKATPLDARMLRFDTTKVNLVETTGSDPADAVKADVANAWFSATHCADAPSFTEEEAKTRMEPYLASVNNGFLIDAMALAIRKSIKQTINANTQVNGIDQVTYLKTIDGAESASLHTPDKFVTQIVSLIGGTRTLASFARDALAGKNVMPPGFSGIDCRSANRADVSHLLELADTSNLQLRNPRRLGDFMLVVETNFSGDAIENLIAHTGTWFPTYLGDNVSSEVFNALVKNRAKGGDECAERLARIEKRFQDSASYSLGSIGLMCRATGDATLSSIRTKVVYDSFGRTVFVMQIPRSVAMAAIMFACPKEQFEQWLDFAEKTDPNTIVLNGDDWARDLVPHLLFDSRTAGRLHLHQFLKYRRYTAGQEEVMLERYVPVMNYFRTSAPVSERFAALLNENAGTASKIDPN